MKRLTQGGAEAITSAAALILVAAVLLLSAAFLADGRRDLADRRLTLMAAASRIGSIPLGEELHPPGSTDGTVAGRSRCEVTTSVRILSGSTREVTVSATVPSGEGIRLVRRFHHAID